MHSGQPFSRPGKMGKAAIWLATGEEGDDIKLQRRGRYHYQTPEEGTVSLSNSRGGGGIIIKLQRRGWYCYQTPEEGVVSLSNSRGGGGIKSQVRFWVCQFFYAYTCVQWILFFSKLYFSFRELQCLSYLLYSVPCAYSIQCMYMFVFTGSGLSMASWLKSPRLLSQTPHQMGASLPPSTQAHPPSLSTSTITRHALWCTAVHISSSWF